MERIFLAVGIVNGRHARTGTRHGCRQSGAQALAISFRTAYLSSILLLVLVLIWWVLCILQGGKPVPHDLVAAVGVRVPFTGLHLYFAPVYSTMLGNSVRMMSAWANACAAFVCFMLHLLIDSKSYRELCWGATCTFMLWTVIFVLDGAGVGMEFWGDRPFVRIRFLSIVRWLSVVALSHTALRDYAIRCRQQATEPAFASDRGIDEDSAPSLIEGPVIGVLGYVSDVVLMFFVIIGGILARSMESAVLMASLVLFYWMRMYSVKACTLRTLAAASGRESRVGQPVSSAAPIPRTGERLRQLDRARATMEWIVLAGMSTTCISYAMYAILPIRLSAYAPAVAAVWGLSEAADHIVALLFQVIFTALEFEENAALKLRLQLQQHASSIMQQSVDARKLFLRYIFHEVRVPFNAVKLALDVLRCDASLSDCARESVLMAESSAESMSSIINNVLQLSAMEQGAFVVRPVPSSVLQIMMTIEHQMRPWALDNRIACTYVTDPDMPPWLLIDAPRVSQILTNFVSNALKFTSHEGTGRVDISARSISHGTPNVCVRFEVRDSGCGISEEEQAKLFQPYYQINSGVNAKAVVGTGLGLAIAREIASQHGGVSGSYLKRGYPVVATADTAFGTAQGVALSSYGKGDGAGLPGNVMRVLIVDDDVSTVKLMERAMKHIFGAPEWRGFRVEFSTAANGALALAVVEHCKGLQERPVLITMDAEMPELDGYAATQAIRAHERTMGWAPTCVIIGCTGNALLEDQQNFIDAGVNAVAIKPLSINDLRDRVSQLLGPSASAR